MSQSLGLPSTDDISIVSGTGTFYTHARKQSPFLSGRGVGGWGVGSTSFQQLQPIFRSDI